MFVRCLIKLRRLLLVVGSRDQQQLRRDERGNSSNEDNVPLYGSTEVTNTHPLPIHVICVIDHVFANIWQEERIGFANGGLKKVAISLPSTTPVPSPPAPIAHNGFNISMS